MLQRAKILLVGTCAATALSAGAASSQIVNGQLQMGDIVAGQALDVVDPAEGVELTTTAAGNKVHAASEGQDLRLRSDQKLEGAVHAHSDAVIHGWSPTTAIISAAVGNSADTAATYGQLKAKVDQVVGPDGSVEAHARVSAHPSSSGDTSVLAHALGNDQRHAVEGGPVKVVANQYNYGSHTTASGQASLAHVKGHAGLTVAAGANQLGVDAVSDETRVKARQAATGVTQASADAYVANGYTTGALSSAAANSVTLNGQGASAELKAEQQSLGYVRAETVLTVGQFGGVDGNAYGVGNTVSAASIGEQLTLNTDQLNTGGVDAVSSFDGGDGYDAQLSSSAYGNAVSASVCSDCDGALIADNAQVNVGDINAQTRINVGGGGRTIRGMAQAVGNSASYITSRPKH